MKESKAADIFKRMHEWRSDEDRYTGTAEDAVGFEYRRSKDDLDAEEPRHGWNGTEWTSWEEEEFQDKFREAFHQDTMNWPPPKEQ